MFSSFGQSVSQSQQQPNQQQQQQQQQQPASQFAQSSPFGAPQQQQQQQQPGFGSPMTLNELNRGSQNMFGQQQQQQPQPQPQPQPQSHNQFSHSTWMNQPQQLQHQTTSGQWLHNGQQAQQQPNYVPFGQQAQLHAQQQQQPQQPHNAPYQQQSYNNTMQPTPAHHQASPWSSQPHYGQGPMHDAGQPPMQPMQQQTYLPGYLSRIKSQRPYSPSASRNAQDGSSSDPPQRDHDDGSGGIGSGSTTTPNSRSSRDGGRRGSLDGSSGGHGDHAGSTSPKQGFSSSFFNSDGQQRTFAGNESIFGTGGLRGSTNRSRHSTLGGGSGGESLFGTPSRETPGRGRSTSGLRSSSGRGLTSPGSFHDGIDGFRRGEDDDDDDDDDAPPSEALADVTSSGRADGVSAGASASASASANGSNGGGGGGANAASLSISPRGVGGVVPSRGAGATPGGGLTRGPSSAVCNLVLYGYPSTLRQMVLSHFASMGEIVGHEARPVGQEGGSECLRITYADATCALRALRRSGEVVGNVAYVGVRLEDEGLHREMVLNGISALANVAGAGATVTAGIGRSNTPTAPSTTSATTPSTTAGAPAATFGRPISFIDSPGAALRPKAAVAANSNGFAGSPLRIFGAGVGTKADGSQQQQQQPQQQQPGMMGRLGDAIFGW